MWDLKTGEPSSLQQNSAHCCKERGRRALSPVKASRCPLLFLGHQRAYQEESNSWRSSPTREEHPPSQAQRKPARLLVLPAQRNTSLADGSEQERIGAVTKPRERPSTLNSHGDWSPAPLARRRRAEPKPSSPDGEFGERRSEQAEGVEPREGISPAPPNDVGGHQARSRRCSVQRLLRPPSRRAVTRQGQRTRDVEARAQED